MEAREIRLSRPKKSRPFSELSRREFLARCGQRASLAFLPAGLGFPSFFPLLTQSNITRPTEYHLHPQYRSQRELDAVLRKVQPGFDEFVTEKYGAQISAIFGEWSTQLLGSPQKTDAMEKAMAANFSGSSPKAIGSQVVRDSSSIRVLRMKFAEDLNLPREALLSEWRASVSSLSRLLTAEFQVTSIRVKQPQVVTLNSPLRIEIIVRYELVGAGAGFHREQRIGNWKMEWELSAAGDMQLYEWRAVDEERSVSLAPIFVDVGGQAFGGIASYAAQLVHGIDYWRTILDGACGIDIYGHNGVSAADIDGDGLDDLYICQPSGLPNRLYRNRGDGTFEDITAASGLGLLENTACALFVDIDNDGRQDAIVVRANGPLLYLNEGGGKFRLKPDAFQFAAPPQGTFTGAAVADYDRDGWLDIYFCLYSYYQGADQYRYPCPYYDAENGPPNFLMRNQRDGTFRDVTREAGLDKNNTRFSFCCGWGDSNGDGWPDLYVVNDFGRKNLYRNKGDGTFEDVAARAGVEDTGAGMGVCWLDYDNDGKQDLYVADMWTAAGMRISEQEIFQKNGGAEARALYRKHAMGNSLFRNRGAESFENQTEHSGAGVGRWAWSSDSWDFDHDGFQDIYITNGMVSGPASESSGRASGGTSAEDLNSFFWRQVVANSPKDAKPNHEYEQGWNAINELIRADGTWSGFERNVFYANNGDGTFSDVSGIVGMDFPQDSRTFALADFDQDGRLEVLLKNRNAPQLRMLKNFASGLPPAIAFRLRGKASNRDAIGATVTIETATGRQTRVLQAGSGFLAQHSKQIFFGLGAQKGPVKATIRWPNGLEQKLSELPANHRIWVEEGEKPTRMEPFKAPPARPAPSVTEYTSESEALPTAVETWLLAPVAAPDFSLPDLKGNAETLSSRRGKRVLLHFWTSQSPDFEQTLENFEKSYPQWVRSGLQLVAVNADVLQKSQSERELAPYSQFSFAVLRGSADVLAVYNILFRSLFDRHRDLPLPTSFLLDESGNIVKIYQGPFTIARLEEDSIPKTSAERMAKALPFPGVLENYEFGRNYLSFGSVFFERGYLEQSEAFFKLAQREEPTGAEALYGLGSIYLQQQKSAEAQKSFEQAVELHANYPGTMPKAWNNLGILAARGGQPNEAIGYFQRSLQIDPDFLIALVNLGNAYRQKKQWDEAKGTLERALRVSADDPEANYGLGMVYAQLGDTDRALQHLQKALAARPAYPEALNNLGVLYLRINRPGDAEKSFKECVRVAPAFDQAYLNLARLYTIEGDKQKARGLLKELLQQHPDHPQAQKELDQLQ
jgi:tetratricopeptide (TPR) repeat protein